MICTNDMAAKALEVRETINDLCPADSPFRAQMMALYARGAFRHDVDVAYASAMLKRGKGVDELADYLGQEYQAVRYHACDPVWPS